MIFGDWVEKDEQELLRQWLVASRTGLSRIRAGLPTDMVAGDKTGTCGVEGRESYNDVAFLIPAAGAEVGHVLAVYLDRPKAKAEDANAALAHVATSFTPVIPR